MREGSNEDQEFDRRFEIDGPVMPRRVYTAALFRGDREIVIVHRGQEYRLRITKADKLILTK